MIQKIYVFINGTVAACDEDGRQMANFQGHYREVVDALRGQDLSGAKIHVMVWEPRVLVATAEEFFSLGQGPDGQLVKGEEERDETRP